MKDEGGMMNRQDMQPDREILDTLVKRILETAQPLRIILFGSAAEGRMGPDSDLDVLVIMQDGTHRRRTAQQVYRCLAGIGVPKDIVVVTQSDVREYGDKPSLVLFSALRKGKELYRAAR